MATVRTVLIGMLIGALGWGTWLVLEALRENARAMPAAAKNVPIKPPELFTSGGVLDADWLARTLDLPKNVSLVELDLDKLRARLLADGQVTAASLSRTFPDRLTVKIAERTPVARIKVMFGSEPRELLVAADGYVYAGTGYARETLDALPWLAGFSLARDGAWFLPIPGMYAVANLLTKARTDAPHLFPTWHIVSMERLQLDDEIDVITKNGTTVVFDARSSYFKQLAWLDSIVERLEQMPMARARIDLSLGRDVPVMIEPLDKTAGAATATVRPAAAPTFPSINIFQAKTTREL